MPREVKCQTWKGEPFKYAHAKRDGIWLELVKDAAGRVTAWSRQPRDYTGRISWHGAFKAFAELAPAGTVLYCEAWVYGGTRDDVKGAIRDRDERLRVECFASPTLGGPNACLDSMRELVEECGVQWVPHASRGSFMCDVELLRDMLLGVKLPDSEGWVVKDGNLLNWRKVKNEETYDLLIVGFTAGRKKYEGLIGALVCESSNGVRVRCSGMTDEARALMTINPQDYLGRVAEVECSGRGSAGGLQHPRFVRVREDKTEADEL